MATTVDPTGKATINGDPIPHLKFLEREVDAVRAELAEVRRRVCAIEKQRITGRMWDVIVKVGAGAGFAAVAVLWAHQSTLTSLQEKVGNLPPRYLQEQVNHNSKAIESLVPAVHALETGQAESKVLLQSILKKLED